MTGRDIAATKRGKRREDLWNMTIEPQIEFASRWRTLSLRWISLYTHPLSLRLSAWARKRAICRAPHQWKPHYMSDFLRCDWKTELNSAEHLYRFANNNSVHDGILDAHRTSKAVVGEVQNIVVVVLSALRTES